MRSNAFLSRLHRAIHINLLLTLTIWVVLCASRWASAQTYKVLHSFTGSTGDGAGGMAILDDENGNLYGTTDSGGVSYHGTAFKLSSAGEVTILYNFLAGYGAYPNSLLGWKGEFYGSTISGGAHRDGAIFKLDQRGNEVVLHSFSGSPDDGDVPTLWFRGVNGFFYGTTMWGGLTVMAPCLG